MSDAVTKNLDKRLKRIVGMDIIPLNECNHSTTPRALPTTTSSCLKSNRPIARSGFHNLDIGEDGAGRGIKKQKYPLDDYLINANTQPIQQPLLSPISPVSSPETVDVLQNAERLVKSAQKQIMEVSFNSVLNTFEENSPSYMGQQSLDDSLLYVREIVDSKFQESNDPNGIHIRKASTSNVADSNRKLRHDQFPVKESTGFLNKPLEISAQNSEFFTNHMAKGIFVHSEKPFFKKAPNWFKIEPPKHINVFPTSTTSNLRSKTKSSCTVPQCTMTNTGVIEINSRDQPNGTIQIQTGPTVDIRGGLTIQTIENVHISPDPSSVPIYNNIATYCFQHEPSTTPSLADSNKTHFDKYSVTSSNGRNIYDTRKETHIQSTDYNDIHKVVHIESIRNAEVTVMKNSIDPSHDTNQDIIGTHVMLTNSSSNNKFQPASNNNDSNSNNDNVNRNELDLSSTRNWQPRDCNVNERPNYHKSSKTSRQIVDHVTEDAHLKKAVSINLAQVKSPSHEEVPVTDEEAGSENKETDLEQKFLSKGCYDISSSMKFVPSEYVGQKFSHVQSDTDYVQRSQICGEECKTASCSRKCEKDVEYREKQKLKVALETIANIEKIRFDIKDTGIVPAECTQMCEEKNHCIADTMSFEFEPLSEPERFKVALENFCKFSQNAKTSRIDTNSKMFQEAVDGFVKMFFDTNTQSNPIHKLYSPAQNFQDKDKILEHNKQSMEENIGMVEKVESESKNKEAAKTLKQVKLISTPKQVKDRQRSNKIAKPDINNVADDTLYAITKNTPGSSTWQVRTDRPKELNKYHKPLAPKSIQLPEDKAAQREKALSEKVSNKEEIGFENLDLKEPCISNVDAVLKIYRESMAAICQGTEQLSQLISHHIMKNAVTTDDQISPPPIPKRTVILDKRNVEPCNAGNENIPSNPALNFVPLSSAKIPKQLVSVHQENSANQSCVQRTCANRIQARERTSQKHGQGITQLEDSESVSRDDGGLSNENNSVYTNETTISAANEYSSMRIRNPSDQSNTLSNNDDKSSPEQFNAGNDTNDSTATSKVRQQIPMNVRSQLASGQYRTAKSVRKSGKNQFMNVQYCKTEPFEAPIPIEIIADKKYSTLEPGLKNSLSAYLRLGNAGSKDTRIPRHSNYNIHDDQSGDFNLYKCPVLISGPSNNSNTSNIDSDDKLVTAESVMQTKELDLQLFGKVLDAVKNSSQFVRRFIISLFDGMEIDCVSDIVRDLENAAVHPIVIEQILVILKERNKDKCLIGGNLILTHSVPTLNDWQNNYNEPAAVEMSNNVNNFKHSIGFNGSMETTNTRIDKDDEELAAPHTADNQITENSHSSRRQMNLNLQFNDCKNPFDISNSKGDECHENELPSVPVEFKIIPGKHIAKENLKHNQDNLPISKTTFEKKSCPSEPLLISRCGIIQVPELGDELLRRQQQDCREARRKSLQTDICQNNEATSKVQNYSNDWLKDSSSNNTASKKNDSESNTDKDISFLIPHDADINNEIADSSDVQELTSITLKNEATGEIIGFQIESNSQNCSQLNSLVREKSTKINSNSDPGQSSIGTNKSSEKSKNFIHLTVNDTNSSNLQRDDSNIICHCRISKDHKDRQIESQHVPCQSSLDALINLQIQSNYKQLGLLDSEEKAVFLTPNKINTSEERVLNKRPKSSKLSATSKSHARKAYESSRSGGNKKKSLDKKVKGNQKVSRDNKQGLTKGTKNKESSESEESDLKNTCHLCIRLQGKCSCLDCRNCISNLKGNKEVSTKVKKEKEKLIKNISSPDRSRPPKRLGYIAGKYSSQKELSPNSKELSSRLITAPPEPRKNFNSNSTDCSPRKLKNNEQSISRRSEKDAAFIAKKSKLKSSSGGLRSDGNNNDGSISSKVKQRRDNDSTQVATSDSDNLKVENKWQNTGNSADIIACKSTETEDAVIPCVITACKSTETLCKMVIISDKASLLLPKKLDKIAEINIIDIPSVKEASTLKPFQNCSLSQDQYTSVDCKHNYYDQIETTRGKVNRCTEIKNGSAAIGSQTSKMCNDLEKKSADLSKTISEAGIVSAFKTTCSNIFDEQSIIVLQPLNEWDHTFFIVKPNCAEKKIIQEKLNTNFNVRVKELTNRSYSSDVHESRQRQKGTNKEVIHCNSESIKRINCTEKGTGVDITQLNSLTSTMSCAKNKECQTGCAGGFGRESLPIKKQSSVAFASTHIPNSDESFLEYKEDCIDLCTNNDECLRICPPPLPEADDSRLTCKQDCPNEEICLKLCPPISQVEPSLQSSSININGILKKFIAENNVPNVKLPLVKGLLQELTKLEDSLRAEQDKLGTIYENLESQIDRDTTAMIKVKELVAATEPRCKAEGSHGKSVQYEEPHEKFKHIMANRKSVHVPNVVRGVADMHPSTKLHHLKLRSAVPLVSGSFNKPESDRRYSLFNRPDPGSSSIDLNDPKVQKYLASLVQKVRAHEGEESSSDSAVDVIQSIPIRITKKMPKVEKPNSKNASKLNKSSRGMDADFSLANALNERSVEHDKNSIKSFKSSDLEPGEFLQVRTPFDNPIKSCQSSVRIDLGIGQLLQDQGKCNGSCNDGKNLPRLLRNADYTNTQKTTKIQHKDLECKYDLCKDSVTAIYVRKNNKGNSRKLVSKPGNLSPNSVKSVINDTLQIVDKNDPDFEVSSDQLIHIEAEQIKCSFIDDSRLKNQFNHIEVNNDKIPKAENPAIAAKLNTIQVTERHAVNDNRKSLKTNNGHSSKVTKDSHGIINENQCTEDVQEYSDQLPDGNEFSNRPQIIDHFLGKTKLEDMKIKYTNDKTDKISTDYQRLESNCQQLYLQSDFISKTNSDLVSRKIIGSPDLLTTHNYDAAELNFTSKMRNKTDSADCNENTSKHWDQTSSDTYSEGEINLPSSCSYSLGEVKISTPSGTTMGKSFNDPDGFTVFVTKSILDSANATCTSPGEILAEIYKTETYSSSSIS